MLIACLAVVASRPEGVRKLEQVLTHRHPVPIDAVTHAADHNGQRFVAAFGIGVVRDLVGGPAAHVLRSAVANFAGTANHQAGLMLGIVSALLVAMLQEEQRRNFLSGDQLAQLILLACDAVVGTSGQGLGAGGGEPPLRLGPFEDEEQRFRQAEREIGETPLSAASFVQGPAASHDDAWTWAQYGAVGLIGLAMLATYLLGGWGN